MSHASRSSGSRGRESSPYARNGRAPHHRQGQGHGQGQGKTPDRRQPQALASGQRAEAFAAAFLEAKGYRILARNVRCRFGELDLIACQGQQLVVVEVRARASALGETGLEQALSSVSPAKRRKVWQAARWWLDRRPHLREYPVRFDVVAVDLTPQGQLRRVLHMPGAFAGEQP
ncbi:MAG TPA: YraN family protein [Limnochordales bacterium]